MTCFHPTRCVALLALLCISATAADIRKTPPNIVMIISDDLGWHDYGFMGHPHVRTPHLDRLASQSLVFTRGYVPTSLCSPSLASIITGLYPHQHKITSNDPSLPPGITAAQALNSPGFRAGRETMNRHLEAVPTLPRLLAQKGYASFQSGKWWLGDFSRGGFTHGMSRGSHHGDDGLAIGRQTLKPIYDFITNTCAAGKPFFVWYAPMMPHNPHDPPERLLQKYRDQTPSLEVAKYWAMVDWFDETVGELLGFLDQTGRAENTIVVYVSDNGWIQDPAGPKFAPKSKNSPYDGGLRTPIMIRWPGRVRPERSEAFAQSIDFVPTLLTAVGIKPSRDLPGINLLDARAVRARRYVYGECFTPRAQDLDRPGANLCWRWVIEGDWKLLVPASQNEPDARVELYDLSRDPREQHDLAAARPAEVRRLQRRLDLWWDGR